MAHRFFNLISKYKLDDLLVQISDISSRMFEQNTAVEDIPVTVSKGFLSKNGNVTLTAWGLLKISYHAIVTTHDFVTMSPTFDNIIEICYEFNDYDNQVSGEVYKDTSIDERLLFDMFGLTQEQFWFQKLHLIKEMFNRDVELLDVIPSQIKTNINLNEIIQKTTDFDMVLYRKLLLAVYASKRINGCISISDHFEKYDERLNRDNISKTIKSLSANYHDYRQSPLRHKYFYAKPIVQTTANMFIAVNQYLLALKITDGVFWTIRDYFMQQDRKASQKFTNEFGKYFERYVENLLNHFLDPKQFIRVPEGKKKNEGRADWIIHTQKYQIIVEQKSRLLSITLKDVHMDIQKLNEYLEEHKEGFIQLDKTTRAYSKPNKTIIKLLLHYELLHMAENILKEKVMSMLSGQLKTYDNYFFIYIGDFEHLLQILHEDENIFNLIIEEKIGLEKPTTGEGKEFNQIIPKFYNKRNEYINEHLNHYSNYLFKC